MVEEQIVQICCVQIQDYSFFNFLKYVRFFLLRCETGSLQLSIFMIFVLSVYNLLILIRKLNIVL